jgi:hypothetical protein
MINNRVKYIYLPPVLYNLYFLRNDSYTHFFYFLPHQFHFLSNLVSVVYEKTEMVPPSDFPSKTKA